MSNKFQSKLLMSAVLIGLLLSVQTRAAAQYNEVAREHRRGAMQIWNQEKVSQDSELRMLKENSESMNLKMNAFVANNKDAFERAGRYGDADALKREPLLPSNLAAQTVADLEDAVKTKESQLQDIKAERAQNPSALDLYRDELHAQVAVTALTGRLQIAKASVIFLEQVEMYANIRLMAASSVSRQEYTEELDNGRRSLATAYQGEQHFAHGSFTMMNFFLAY